MTSILEVEQLDTLSSNASSTLTIGGTNTTTINLGASGKSIVIPSGATIVNNGTQTGFGGENTPAFHAYLSSAQTGVSDGVFTKCIFNAEKFDSDGCYDTATGRFTPTVAGKYYVYTLCSINSLSPSNVSLYLLAIRKNGGSLTQGVIDNRNVSNGYVAGQYCGLVVDMNGSSDYLEVFGHIDNSNSASMQFQGSEQENFFGAYKIIGA